MRAAESSRRMAEQARQNAMDSSRRAQQMAQDSENWRRRNASTLTGPSKNSDSSGKGLASAIGKFLLSVVFVVFLFVLLMLFSHFSRSPR